MRTKIFSKFIRSRWKRNEDYFHANILFLVLFQRPRKTNYKIKGQKYEIRCFPWNCRHHQNQHSSSWLPYLRIVRGYSESEKTWFNSRSYRNQGTFKAIVLDNLQLPWLSHTRKIRLRLLSDSFLLSIEDFLYYLFIYRALWIHQLYISFYKRNIWNIKHLHWV